MKFSAASRFVAFTLIASFLAGAALMPKIQFYTGSGSGKSAFNLSSGKFYQATGSSKALCNISGSHVFQVSGSSSILYNVSGSKLFKGSGSSSIACNWSGGSLSTVELAAAVWLVEHPY